LGRDGQRADLTDSVDKRMMDEVDASGTGSTLLSPLARTGYRWPIGHQPGNPSGNTNNMEAMITVFFIVRRREF